MTEYFSAFPKINYDGETVKDITIRLDFLNKIKGNISLFEHVQVIASQKPEDLALIHYGDTNLYWIILFMNDIIDPYYDWLLTEDQLVNFIKTKYGVESVYAVHHYETTSFSDLGEGIIQNGTEPFVTPISNFTFESRINDAKRKIKILKRQYIKQVIDEYKSELRR